MLRFNDGAWEECGRSWAQEQESKRMGVSMIDLKSWCESRHWEELLSCYAAMNGQAHFTMLRFCILNWSTIGT